MNLKFLEEEGVMMRDIHTAVNDIEWGMKEIVSAMDYIDTSDGKKIPRTLVGNLLQEGISNFERGIKSFEYFKDNMKSIENGVLKEADKIKKELNEKLEAKTADLKVLADSYQAQIDELKKMVEALKKQ